MFEIQKVNLKGTIRISFAKTIVGFYNVRNVATGEVVNVNPVLFRKLFPHISPKAIVGADDLHIGQAIAILGFTTVGEVA